MVGKKNVLIIADLGAGANIVKNLLSLGNYAWPLKTDKFQTLMGQYREDLVLQDWLKQEYVLRYWKKFFGIDLSDGLDYDLYCEKLIPYDLPIIFINHTAVYQPEEFLKFSHDMETLFVAPTSSLGLEWQIRAYCEKKTIEQLHDFTFEQNREQAILDHKNCYGHESYYELNIMNMKKIIQRRQHEFRTYIDNRNFLPLENLLMGSAVDIVDFLNDRFQQELSFDETHHLITSWKKLHWPMDQTAKWRYHHLFT